MRRSLRLSTIVVAVGSAVLATAAAPAGAAPASPSAAAPAATRIVRLITGDTVGVRTVAGRTVATVLRASSGEFTSTQVGTHRYVLPPAARYYGAVLDPALFDVTATHPASTPVDVTFTGARPTVPGLTVTSASSTSLHGYVSATGSRAFGAALLAQMHRDVRAGVPAPTSLFGATRVTLAAAPAVHPDFPQVTLIVDAVGTDGAKLRFGDFALINTDDGRKYNGFVFIFKGQARVSVPLGNYSLIGEQDTFTENGDDFSFDSAVKTIPDFAVTQPTQRLLLDFRDATVRPSISIARPVVLQQFTAQWVRTVPHGGLSFAFGGDPSSTVEVAPAPAPVRGTVDWETSWTLLGKPARTALVRYDAAYDDQGAIPADQSHTYDLAQAGRVDANFYAVNRSKTAYFGRGPIFPADFGGFISLLPQPVPLAQTQYAVSSPQAQWEDAYDPGGSDNAEQFIDDGPRTYPAGSQQRIDWLRGPLAAGVAEPTSDQAFAFCQGCRTEDQLELGLAPITDSTPGHAGDVFVFDEDTKLADFTLYRNGTKINSVSNATGDVVSVPPGEATYRAVVDTYVGAAGNRRSTHAVTDLTFRSGGGEDGALPDGWFCDLKGECSVLPLLTATVPLPTDLTGAMPLGRSTFDFTIDGARGGPAPAATTATMSISVAGAAERTVPVTALGGGTFRATITHPAADAGKLVTLKVGGADGQGDSITETVTAAYAVANS